MSDDERSEDSLPMDDGADVGSMLASEGDICGDGSILKEILAKGTGVATPTTGAEVKVHYVGTLQDGTKFDSSRDRGDPFQFKIGMGQVIKGWDQGVATMLKGETAKFTINGDKAYGARGSPPKIPPNATLVFEVELISWQSEQDISEKKDGSLLKDVLKAGEGYKSPAELSSVDIHFTLALEDGTVVKTSGDASAPQTFVIDDGSLLPGVEAALLKMKKGEHAKVTIAAALAFGAAGDAALGVGPNAAIIADITLVGFVSEKDTWDMSVDEKTAASDRLRELGNALFKTGDYARAKRRYAKALAVAESGDSSAADEAKAVFKGKKLLAQLNVGACQLKLGSFKEASDTCTKVLALDAANVKGLFRRGTALLELGDWDAAKKDLKRALELEPANAAAAAALQEANRRVAKQEQSDRKRYKGMFERMAALSAKEAEATPSAPAAEALPAVAVAAADTGAAEEGRAAEQ